MLHLLEAKARLENIGGLEVAVGEIDGQLKKARMNIASAMANPKKPDEDGEANYAQVKDKLGRLDEELERARPAFACITQPRAEVAEKLHQAHPLNDEALVRLVVASRSHHKDQNENHAQPDPKHLALTDIRAALQEGLGAPSDTAQAVCQVYV